MRLHAFTMRLKPGHEAEYERRHRIIWPELAQLLREAGVSDYSIFLDPETLTLFGVQRQADAARVAALSEHPVMRRWWAYMADLMETHSDQSPVCRDLQQVFHLD